MKRFLFCLFLFLLTSCLTAREPQWIFNNGPDIKKVTVGQGDLQTEVNLLKINPTGSDLTFSVPMPDSKPFSAEYRFFAFRYKMKTDLQYGGLFFTTETLTSLSDKSYSQFPIKGDGTWQNQVVDMTSFRHGQWKGTITSFRLDPTNPSNISSEIMISRIGFFKTSQAATAFLEQANDKPDYSIPSVFSGEFQRAFVPGGSLFDGYQQKEFLLTDEKPNQFDAIRRANPERIVVTFEGKDGKRSVLPAAETNRYGFTAFVAKRPGRYFLTEAKCKNPIDTDSVAIRYLLCRGIMQTDASGAFRPNDQLSANEYAKIHRILKSEDVSVAELDAKLKAGTVSRLEAACLIVDAIKNRLGTKTDSPYPAEYFTRDRIRIGSWGNFRTTDVDENYLKTYSDCGFDWLIAMSNISSGALRGDLFRWCNKYGIEVFINDGGYMDPKRRIAEYGEQPSFAGHYVIDEPGSDSYDELAAICNKYTDLTGGKTPYVNLLPMYANAAQLKYGAGAAAIEYYDSDPQLFKKYCDSFCEKFRTSYICTDIYPLNWTKDKKRNTYKDYVESINIIATSAREHQRDFWCFIQTFAWTPSKRTPNEAEFRWQCYSMLSFGCKGILCWTYACSNPKFPSLVDYESKKTQAWYDARPVFHEVRNISDVFVQYANRGAFTHNYSEKVPYLRMTNEYKDFKTIKEIKCSDPLLIGCFEKKKGSGSAFTLVNMSELQDAKTVVVELTLTGSKVTAYPRGKAVVLKPENGCYKIQLPTGEGVFVTVD